MRLRVVHDPNVTQPAADSHGSSGARTPAPVQPAGPPPPFTVSGVVFEMTPTGRVPVEGVTLYCDSCGSPGGHTFTSSDGEGRYSFAWSVNGVHVLQVWKDGFRLALPNGSYRNGTEYRNGHPP
jgi:hypothetical protein